MPEAAFRRILCLAAGTLPLYLATCDPTVPCEALQRTSTAFVAVVVSSAPLLTDLAKAERRNFRTRTEAFYGKLKGSSQ